MRRLLIALLLMPLVSSSATTYYVDVSKGSDGNSGRSALVAKRTIQAAIDVAVDGDVINVEKGTYSPITTGDKRITITGVKGAQQTVIDGRGTARCVFASVPVNTATEASTNLTLIGFTLCNGYVTEGWGAGMFGGVLRQCIIKDNRCPNGGGGGVGYAILYDCLLVGNYAINGGATEGCELYNCTVTGNSVRDNGSAAWESVFINCIIYNNNRSQWFYWNEADIAARHHLAGSSCRINICADDPKFVDAANGDYRLAQDSPCIDVGDNSYVQSESDLAGNRRIANGKVDIGAYEYAPMPIVTIYTITFDANGGEPTPSAITLKDGEKYGALPTVTRNGYAFDGWYTAADGGERVLADDLPTCNLTLFAHWSVESNVFGDGLDCEGFMWKTGGTKVYDDESVDWVTVMDADCVAGNCVKSGSVDGEGAVTWIQTTIDEPGTISYKYKFQSYSGEFAVTCDDDVLLSRKGPTGTGVGWTSASQTIAAGGSHRLRFSYRHDGVGYGSGHNGVMLDDFVFTPTHCHLILKANNGTDDSEEILIKMGEASVLPKVMFSNPNSTFQGWAESEAGEVKYSDGAVVNFSGRRVTLYARWRTYSYAGMLDVTGCEFLSGGNGEWVFDAAESKSGECSVRSGNIGDWQTSWLRTSVTGPTKLSFWWKVSSEADFDFLKVLLDGGEVQSISGEVDWRQVSFIVQPGVHTIEWQYAKSVNAARGADCGWVDQIQFSEDYYVVTFDGNGGTPSDGAKAYAPGATYGEMPECTRGGSRFLGWYTQAEGGVKVGPEDVVPSNVTLYAHWEERSYGLLMRYYDEIGDDYATWNESWESMRTYFSARTPALTDWSDLKTDTLDFGDTGSGCKYHGKYASASANNFAMWMTGYVALRFCGEYEFNVRSDDGFTLYVDGRLVANYAGARGMDAAGTSGKVMLTKGVHRIDLVHRDVIGGQGLCMTLKVPFGNALANILQADCPKGAEIRFETGKGRFDGQERRYIEGLPLLDLPNPVYEGHEFLGWYTREDGGVRVEASDVFEGQTVLFAHWEDSVLPNATKVEFDANGGMCEESEFFYTAKQVFGWLPSCTRTGYDFVGWYTTSGGGMRVEVSSIVTEGGTLYAHWEKQLQDLTFDTAGGCAVGTISVPYGECVGNLPIPTKEGCVFDGWYDRAVGGSRLGADAVITAGQKLYAHWKSTDEDEVWLSDKKLDICSGARRTNEAQQLTISPEWEENGVKAIVSVDGVPYQEATSAGECTWAGMRTKEYTLTHQVVDAGGAAVGEPYVAKFNWVNRVTITFEARNGEESLPRSYDETFAYGELPTVSRIGYAFDGWYTAAEGGTKVVETDKVSSATTLYGHWINNTYFVRFIAGDGEGVMANQPFKYDVPQALSANQYVRLGYAFSGWLCTNGVEDVIFANREVVSNLTVEADAIVDLSAVWFANSYSVKFNANGGSGSMANEPMTYDTEKALTTCAFTKTGYAFAGWATSAGGEVVYANGEFVKNLAVAQGAIVDLYAQWSVNNYTVKFNANGGTGTMANEPMTYDAEKALTDCAFTRTGYTFAGWTMSAGGAVKYANGATVKNLAASGTVTLYAKWTPNNYVIDFNPGLGGTGTMADQPMTYDEAAALYANLFMRTGYTFLGWTDDPNEVEEALYYDGAIVENLTDEEDGEFGLYAIWAANEYTVRFNANGGTGTMADQTFLYDEEQALRANGFARTGYTFAGWNGNSGGVAKQFAEGEIVSNLTSEADGVVTMSAVWTANPYTVRFDANGGEGTMGDLNCKYGTGKTLTACAFTRTGYTFAGWAKSVGGAVMYADRANVTDVAASGTVTLYAKWTANSYSVKFNANGGSGTMANESMTYDAGKALTACAFTRTGYTFVGWTTSANGEVIYGNGQSVKNLTATQGAVINLYAKWTANAYMVKFNANGGQGTMADESMTYDAEKSLTACAFTRTGYTFAGWEQRGAAGVRALPDCASVKNLTDVDGGVVTLYAKWTPNSYVIDFNPGQGGEGSMPDQPMTYDEEAALYANLFARTGYTFLGWTDDPSEVEEVQYYDSVVVENLTDEVDGEFDLYAIWAANEYTVKFNANGGKGTMADQAFLYDAAQNLTSNGFTRAGCEFLGWSTSAAGEVVYADGEAVSNLTATADGVVNLYAVWDGTATTWMEDDSFSATVANTYDGYMIDENYNLLGVVQVKTTKQSVKTTTDKKTKVKTVTTNITATATVTDANGKKWSYSKGVVTVDGVVTGLKCTTKGCPVPEFGVKVGANGMDGVWGEYAIFGARNGMGTKGDAMMAVLETYKGKWSVTLSCASLTSGQETASPLVVRLQLNVQAKGVVKIAGNWENGAKVSASAQLVMGDGFVYVPVMVKSTKTTPAINALFRITAGGEVVLLSEGELVKGGRTVEALGEPDYLPSEVSAGGKAFSARVAINELAYPAKFAAKKLPAGLKIDSATGVISGTPTKPGHYVAEVTVTSGLNSRVKKTMTVEFDIANYTDGLIPIRDSYGPYYVGVSADERITAAAGCSVSGLPAGLKWTAKAIVDAKTKTIKTAANTVYGVPSKAGISTVYFKKTVKEPVNGRMKSVTHQASATFVVEGMQPWAIGTFDGGSSNGIVTLTVAKTGKISGKWMSGGLAWTLSAASFDAYISSEQMYVATVIGKSGKLMMTNEIEVTEGGVVAYGARGEDAASTVWEAWRNGWKEEPLKTLAKKLKGQKVRVGEVLLTVGSSGAVTAKGSFVTGFDEKKQKDITYSASCSTVLIPTAEAGQYRVYLYFPPKTGKFDGFTDVVEIGFGDSQ